MNWADDRVLGALRTQHADLATLLHDCDDGDWKRRSACAGWDVSDVVLHLAQTDELAVASVEGRFPEVALAFAADARPSGDTVDDAAELTVAQQRGASGEAVRARWTDASSRLRAALASADPHARVQWVAGELSTRTLATTRLAECWIHTGDVGFAFGVAPAADDRLQHIARLAWRTVPYAFSRAGRELHGNVGFDLVAPSGDAWAFGLDKRPETVVRGDALELCLVAGQRRDARDTGLTADGPDAAAVLELVRTFA